MEELVIHIKQLVKTGYNKIASEYLKTRSEKSKDLQLLQELIQQVPRGAKILDAGCGAGVPVTQILSNFFDVTGVDFSETQVKLAQQLVPKARFICQDMTRLSFPPHSFDAICSYYAIIHVPRTEHDKLLANFHRMLKPMGLILVCMGTTDIELEEAEDYLGTTMYWSHFDAETNIDLITKCGFKVLWSKIIADPTSPGSSHLFIYARK